MTSGSRVSENPEPRGAPTALGRRFQWRAPRGRWLAAIYLGLLALSHLVRWLDRSLTEALPANMRVTEVVAVAGGEPVPATVRLAWKEQGQPEKQDRLPVLLLHGSPGSHRDFRILQPALAKERRTLAPDLPGFGASNSSLPDYSIHAHALYAEQLLDALGIERVHVLGFSMGGGVALHLYERDPNRVASVILLASIGVQELELLGDYQLNRLLHGVQLGLVWLTQEGLPHMGLLDRSPLSLAYARNFLDSDQRSLRAVLRQLRSPMLIVHGDRDPLVPAAAAREHARLVPQSELHMLASDHFFLFRGGNEVVPWIQDFLDRVENGVATVREQATAERLAASLEPFDFSRVPPLGGVARFLALLLLAVATLISEDLTCIGAGLLVAQGRLDFLSAALACFAGIYVGDLLLFWVGRSLGRRALRLPTLSWWLSEEAVARSSAWFRRRGGAAIGLSRFLPGTRLPTYFAAGLLHTNFWKFAGFFFLAAAIWTPGLVGMSFWLGRSALEYLTWVQHRVVVVVIVLVGIWILLRHGLLPLLTFAGRRRLVGRWRRWTRWEFWPPWLFYPLPVLYVLVLGVRYRSLTLFSAANPGMPAAGGFIGESKAEILRRLSAAAEYLPKWRLLPSVDSVQTRAQAVEEFRRQHGLSFPLVLKPDVGQRGEGVATVHSQDQLLTYLSWNGTETLVQEYVPGLELGVFYYRHPGDERGRILSITEKRLPCVIGDGHSTLEELVLQDERAVCLAETYLRQHDEDPWRVPRVGEEVQLVEVGTHCRGAVFLDGGHHATDALESAIDGISKSFEGFFFGRYDLRAGTLEDLRRGGPFKIIELNGVTSEATHIYDARYSLRSAYRTLMRQWRLAFDIGAANRARGFHPASVGELVQLVLRYRRSRLPQQPRTAEP